MKTSRRAFMQKSGLALGAAALASQMPFTLLGKESMALNSFGFQVWTLREKLIADFSGTLKMMAGLGYKEVEMCSPLGYSMAGFAPLNKMSGTEMRKIVEDSGLICRSSHYTMGELRDSLDNRIEWSQQMGITQIICSSFWLPATASVDDYRKAAQELNVIGEKTKVAGIQAGFHNHNMEFEMRGDVLIYDALMEELDPDLVKMQFQVAVIEIGYKAADYFKKYPGRFISAHLADFSADTKKNVPIGQGIVEWKELFEAAKTGGVQNYFVEMEPETFKPSADYLLNM